MQIFIFLLASFLQEHNSKGLHGEDDADLLIVRTAVEIVRKERQAVLVGEDNDQLAVLCHYGQPKNNKLLFRTRNHPWNNIEKSKVTRDLDNCILILHNCL